jgi:cardiolipin synthase
LLLVGGSWGCASPKAAGEAPGSTVAEPVKLKTPRGALSAEQSKAVIEQLNARTPNAGMLERHLAIEEAVSDSPLTTENKAVLLQDGPATYAAMFAAMESAKDYIFVEMYIVEGDEIGQKFSDLWLKKQKAGVPVSLLYDGVGSVGTPKEFFERLRAGGVTVVEFNPVNPLKAKAGWDINERDHRKLLVVDGRVGFVGGINISGVYSGGSSKLQHKKGIADSRPWRDTQVQVEGQAALELQKSYLESWGRASKQPPPGKLKTSVARSSGKDVVRVLAGWADKPDEVNPIYGTFLSAIQNAEKTVHISMAYFVPDPQTMDALKGAAKRGVDVQLILPGFTDFWAVFHAGRSKYDELLEAGVKIHERRERLLHAKTAVIDGVWSTVGSANLDWRSFLHNHELNLVVLGTGFGDQMEAAFRKDLAISTPITLEEWRQRAATDRVREVAARFWEYWL